MSNVGTPTEALVLFRVEFDNMENHDPLREAEVAAFVDGDEKAWAKLARHLRELEPVAVYLGYDDQVYPRFRVERRALK